jgi:hypothetical protein
MVEIRQGKMHVVNELVGWRHFINLKIQNTFGGKNLGVVLEVDKLWEIFFYT